MIFQNRCKRCQGQHVEENMAKPAVRKHVCEKLIGTERATANRPQRNKARKSRAVLKLHASVRTDWHQVLKNKHNNVDDDQVADEGCDVKHDLGSEFKGD